ncbi:putative conserved protein YbbC, DUF1343 family [Abditibacterium utsteinense]|uniref:Putative conserved protein YbbC, DUF1343 family n=1 Tax=Abditibacterium utsteinense TaxID=1960156 RepID=A0A2S8SRU5_9BACT|nr:DUF1343 domain-containing protein [Abditibacterium utsteinense]PQV63496.1 putative conserved protein YbbC, DUF1343 family [Abditibacterium utsteinense]
MKSKENLFKLKLKTQELRFSTLFKRFCVLGLMATVANGCPFSAARAQVMPLSAPLPRAEVWPGINVLESRGFDILQGKRVGLVTNQSGRSRSGEATIDVLRRAPGVNLVALFAPEHGVRGEIAAGAKVDNTRDALTQLPVFSLYGATRQPTPAMLRGIQVLVFDLQEIGARSYTFLATLEKCRQACAQNGIELVVLDRPNPVGRAIEGNIPQQFSFVCPFPIPYRHGLTMGEVARYLNARAARKCQLRVVPMRNYRREPFVQTALTWTRTSPNIPRATSPFFYSATGILGELPALSIGIGTPFPFELAGAPNLDANALAKTLNARHLAGWNFRAASWIPSKGSYAHKKCSGVQILLTDFSRAQTTRLNFEIYRAVRHIAPRLPFFASSERSAMFDKVCGTPQIRRAMQSGQSADSLWKLWNQGAAPFARQSAPFRLY